MSRLLPTEPPDFSRRSVVDAVLGGYPEQTQGGHYRRVVAQVTIALRRGSPSLCGAILGDSNRVG